MSLQILSGGGGSSILGPQWTPVQRAPITAWPPGTYDRTLPAPVPAGRDLYYTRGQFCGIRVPGAPVVPGSEAANPDLVMTCLLDNYPQWVQEAFLTTYAEAGYTHVQRSVGHALGLGVASMASYIALSKRIRAQYGLFCEHWLIAAETPGFQNNQDATYWAPILGPYIDRILGEGVMDGCVPSWQMDGVNQGAPGNPTISIIAYVAGKLPPAVPVYTHWVNDAMAWWYDDGRGTVGQTWTDPKYWPGGIFVNDRFSWWRCMGPMLTGGHYQGNTTLARIDPGTYQGKIRDTLNNFVNGNMGQSTRRGFPEDFRITCFENTAQDQFDNGINQYVVTGPNNAPYEGCPVGTVVGKPCPELEGDTVGWVLSCTKADGFQAGMGGYGNGARRPDGTAL